MNKENFTLKLVDEITLYYDAWLKKASEYLSVTFIVERSLKRGEASLPWLFN